MAICTKFGERIINESLRIDQYCLYSSQIVSDAKNKLRDVINSNLNKRKGAE